MLSIAARRRHRSREKPRACRLSTAGSGKRFPAITCFRAGRHYHRPEELNDRVRNGNECDLRGIVTGKFASGPIGPVRGPDAWACGYVKKAAATGHRLCRKSRYTRTCTSVQEAKINVIKHSPVSTGQLKRLTRRTSPAYRPGSLPGAFRAKAHRDLILRRVSRLYAFSAYPVRTMTTLRCRERDSRKIRGPSA